MNERRRSNRVACRTPALIGPRREEAIIEELGEQGLRIRSGRPLRQRDRVVLLDPNLGFARDLTVVWSRPQGLIEKQGKPGHAYVAGCVVERVRPAIRRRKTGPPSDKLLRLALIGAAVSVGALLLYLLSSIVSIFITR